MKCKKCNNECTAINENNKAVSNCCSAEIDYDQFQSCSHPNFTGTTGAASDKIIIKDEKILESPEFHKYFKVDIPMTGENIKNGIECEIIEQMSDKIKNGGPAFPICDFINDKVILGMSLRDYFAAQAMQGILANSTFNLLDNNLKQMSNKFYKLADAMLEARKK